MAKATHSRSQRSRSDLIIRPPQSSEDGDRPQALAPIRIGPYRKTKAVHVHEDEPMPLLAPRLKIRQSMSAYQ